ncbi:MAG: class I tRNA ligase family protein [Duncaniella sp.]|nr:class I tRNA ligase family protein [Duncaniella sp.]
MRECHPAYLIAEGVDQTRGWFFTLHAIAGMVFDTNSYKAVVSNGLVLDKHGNKMSKRLGNAVDPFGQIETYGADPVRWYMISNSSPWDNLKYDEKGVQDTARKLFSTLYNTYSFFALYANVDGFDPDAPQVPVEKRPEIDRWILSLLNTLVKNVTNDLEDYEPTRAARAIGDFVGDNLSNWYVRLNRKRFWGGEMNDDKLAAYQTLYTCLRTVAVLMAPFAPFFSDRLYLDLTGAEGGESVHLAAYPKADEALIDPALESRMKLAQDITSMVLALRRKVNIKVRQPLTAIMVPVNDDTQRAALDAITELVKNETNVKEIKIVGNEDGILVKTVKPDFKKLGPKHGKNMKAVAEAIKNLDSHAIAAFERDGKITIDVNGAPATVDLADVEIISEDIPGWLVANEGALTVALDITVTPELRNEGIAREIVNRIQNIRKSRDYNITDRVTLVFAPNDATDGAIREFGDYISRQVLARDITIEPVAADAPGAETLNIDDIDLLVAVNKADK